MIRFDTTAFQQWATEAIAKLADNTQRALRQTTASAVAIAKLSPLWKIRTGKLQKKIAATVFATRATVRATAPYAFYVENGTRPHRIKARRATNLRFVQNGEVVFRRSVWHPGTKARPFMANAQKQATPLFSRLVNDAAKDAFK